jgi:hypothetical protein
MRLASVEIANYKSFRDSGRIPLLPGINVIVGENNTGKTSLVEAVGLDFVNQPHRSPETYSPPYVRPPTQSTVIRRFEITQPELLNALRAISPFQVAASTDINSSDVLARILAQNFLVCKYAGGERAPHKPILQSAALEGLSLTRLGVASQPHYFAWQDDSITPIAPPRACR